jgi:hypothetical protein
MWRDRRVIAITVWTLTLMRFYLVTFASRSEALLERSCMEHDAKGKALTQLRIGKKNTREDAKKERKR